MFAAIGHGLKVRRSDQSRWLYNSHDWNFAGTKVIFYFTCPVYLNPKYLTNYHILINIYNYINFVDITQGFRSFLYSYREH
jgi:hypothetical protein